MEVLPHDLLVLQIHAILVLRTVALCEILLTWDFQFGNPLFVAKLQTYFWFHYGLEFQVIVLWAFKICRKDLLTIIQLDENPLSFDLQKTLIVKTLKTLEIVLLHDLYCWIKLKSLWECWWFNYTKILYSSLINCKRRYDKSTKFGFLLKMTILYMKTNKILGGKNLILN